MSVADIASIVKHLLIFGACYVVIFVASMAALAVIAIPLVIPVLAIKYTFGL